MTIKKYVIIVRNEGSHSCVFEEFCTYKKCAFGWSSSPRMESTSQTILSEKKTWNDLEMKASIKIVLLSCKLPFVFLDLFLLSLNINLLSLMILSFYLWIANSWYK